MVYRFIFCAFLILPMLSFSQTQLGDIIDPNRNNGNLWGGGNEESIEGSPYFMDDWLVGEIKTKMGGVYTNVKLKYATYSDQLFFLLNNESERAIAREKVQYFTFNDNDGKSYMFEYVPHQGFMMLLKRENEVTLYKKIEKEIKLAPKSNGYNSSVGKDRFVERIGYYILAEKHAIPVNNRKDYLEIFPSNKDELNKYIKKNKVKFKDDEKVAGLVEFTQSLIN